LHVFIGSGLYERVQKGTDKEDDDDAVVYVDGAEAVTSSLVRMLQEMAARIRDEDEDEGGEATMTASAFETAERGEPSADVGRWRRRRRLSCRARGGGGRESTDADAESSTSSSPLTPWRRGIPRLGRRIGDYVRGSLRRRRTLSLPMEE